MYKCLGVCLFMFTGMSAQNFNFVRNNPFGSFQFFISDITQGPNDTIWVCNVGGEYAKRTNGGWQDTVGNEI